MRTRRVRFGAGFVIVGFRVPRVFGEDVMDSFKWDENFVTGIEEVDAQHMELVKIINRLGELLSSSEMLDGPAVNEVLDELARYTRFHFAAEEGLMLSAGIDSRHLESQKREHAGFVDEVVRLAQTEMTFESANRLLKFLIHWLAYHILGSDQAMARQLALLERGLQPDEAFREDERLGTRATEPLLIALNGLFAQVSERNRELYELNRTLEAKVEARTRELAIANKHLEALSLTDVLTGLPNRRHALHRLKLEWADSAHALSCMMIDADGFKQINDTFGHEAGDVVLQNLALKLQHRVRNDDLVCRLGGDEFLIICPHTPLSGAMHIAEAVRAAVANMRVAAGEGEWRGSISVGVAERSPAMKGPDDLIRLADEGVYLAKRGGRNRVATAATDAG